MDSNYYLTFTLNNLSYGVDTIAVEEIFYLPEITPIPEAPSDIVGIINYRGQIVPIMDLNLRFGYQAPNYQLTDSIILLTWQELRVGIITNQVQEVKKILPSEITTELSHAQNLIPTEQEKFIKGIAPSNQDLFIILDLERLLRYVATQDISLEEGLEDTEESKETSSKPAIFYPQATPKEQEILRKRAAELQESIERKDLTGAIPLAVVKMGEEFFGIDLKLVGEFIKISKLTPIACTPPHILGNMNLRGEILTLIDLRGLLNLPMTGIAANSKAMVIEVEGIVAGILVQEVQNVVLLDPTEIIEVPTVTHSVNEEYLQGVTPYQEKMMSILDLPKALLHGGLIVDEAV